MDRRHFLVLSLFGALAGCGGSGGGGTMTGSSGVLEVARGQNAGLFLRAVATAELTEQLSGDGPYTLFVPTDAALRAAGTPRDREAARALVGHHVVPGLVSSDFMTGMEMNHLTAAGDTLNVDGTGGRIRVAGASVVRADLPARNGVVHIVDRVLTPA